MALWQVSFALYPNWHFVGSNDIIETKLDALLAGNEPAFTDFILPATYQSQIEVLLAPAKSWAPDLELWGDSASDDFSIWRNARGIGSIEVRLDVRKINDALIAGVLWIAKEWNCTLVEKEHRTICRFSTAELRQLLTGHTSNRATRDPAAWLPHLAKQAADDQRP